MVRSRKLGRLGACVTGFCMLLGSASPGSTVRVASTSARVPRAVLIRPAATAYRRGSARTRFDIPGGASCDESSSGFVGNSSPGSDDVAGASYSAILGGQENEACGEYSAIGGGFGSSIAGGGQLGGFIGGGTDDIINGSYDFIGAGAANSIASGAAAAFIGGGGNAYAAAQGVFPTVVDNEVSNSDSFIGAGNLNQVDGESSFIGAGGYTYATSSGKPTAPGNRISGNDSFIGAGDQNVVAANAAFVGSGSINTIDSTATSATILGGSRNRVAGEYGSVLGGFGNTASGSYAIVAGGDGDTAAGIVSFAAGYHADAAHDGSFVWSDYVSGSAVVKDSAANQFVVRASGGTIVYSSENGASGVDLPPGSGTWASLSDRNAKIALEPLDDDAVLAKVAALPIASWQYRSERGVRHVGPMAQDFYAAFLLGADDRHITSIDEDGVALAAVKAVNEKLDRENARLKSALASLEAKVDRLGASSR